MKLIDTDAHVAWNTPDAIGSYLEETWRTRWLHGHGHTQAGLEIYPKVYDPDTWPFPKKGVRKVSALSQLQEEWLAPHGLAAVVLSVFDALRLSTFGDTHYPTAVATAVNRWLTDTFLTGDSRCFGSIVVATQDAEAAAREIRRAAAHPRMVQVVLPVGTRMPYGHHHYRPIFRAAADCGLAVAIAAGTQGMGTSCPPTPNGWPGTAAEMRVAASTIFLCHLTSLITEGVFAEFPTLRIVAQETGVAWMPPFLWRFDKNFKALRSECPWVRDLPSRMVCRHFRFTSQGVEAPEPAGEFWRLLGSLPERGLLMYSSNFPRWDTEPPEKSFALTTCPQDQRDGLAFGEAEKTFPRLAPAQPAPQPAAHEAVA